MIQKIKVLSFIEKVVRNRMGIERDRERERESKQGENNLECFFPRKALLLDEFSILRKYKRLLLQR